MLHFNKIKIMASLLLMMLYSVGCASGKTQTPVKSAAKATVAPAQSQVVVAEATIASGTMSLGPGDIFEVRVYGEKDLSDVYRVSDAGTISFPLAGTIYVNKLDSTEVIAKLTTRLGKYLKSPQVSVFIKEFQSKKVYVFGQVRKPGTFSYQDGMNIIQAITLAGGLQPLANPNATYINRVVNGAEQRIKVAIQDIGQGEAPNIYLKPGDIVYVPESMF
jgi:polysaccharide export outer membrane protein